MDERRVADYFVVAGLPPEPRALEEHPRDGAPPAPVAPITDVGVLFPGLGETAPPGYEVAETDLNLGSLRAPECRVCFRRGRDRPPLVDVGVMYEGKERLMADARMVTESVGGRVANVNNSAARTFITYRRADPDAPPNALVVTDVRVVAVSRGEAPPHAYCLVPKNLNKGVTGADVFLCYKKSADRPPLLCYEPETLLRYPTADREGFPFPASVPLFCLPMGATLEVWPRNARRPPPAFSAFVLTVSDATDKVYGSSVTFHEDFDPDRLTDRQAERLGWRRGVSERDRALRVSKSACLLSHWPFGDTFERWLRYVVDLALSREPVDVPVERHVIHLLEEVPFPEPRILLQLSATDPGERVVLARREDQPLVRSGAGFRQLLFNLGTENCMTLLALALTEQKILIHSLRADTLTAVAEAVSSLLFPFKWQCPYVPLCPLGLAEVLHAPLPYLIGADSRFFDLHEPPPDVSCVDLDTNNVTVCDAQRHVSSRLLPKRPARVLRGTLDSLYERVRRTGCERRPAPCARDGEQTTSLDREFAKRRRELELELEIQGAFLRFMASTLRGYRTFLLPITKAPTVGTTDPQALFQLQAFLRSRDRADHRFFSLLMRTQMFIRFIEERSFVCDGEDHGLAFFDECTERVSGLDDASSHVRLLDIETAAHSSERTVFVLPPDPPRPGRRYVYDGFSLDPALLAPPRAVPAADGTADPQDGSPLARRTGHEIKSARARALKLSAGPETWARCLLGTRYSLYFIALPCRITLSPGKEHSLLRRAYELLVRASKLRVPCDEVCYRVMMQLCGIHSAPVLAVELLFLMKRSGTQPNALTYGFYNKCVLEAQWPKDMPSGSQLLWNKLRVAVMGAALFRRAGARREARRGGAGRRSPPLRPGPLGVPADLDASKTSLDSGATCPGDEGADRRWRLAGTILRTDDRRLPTGVPSEPDLTELGRRRSNSLSVPDPRTRPAEGAAPDPAPPANGPDAGAETVPAPDSPPGPPIRASPRTPVLDDDPLGALRAAPEPDAVVPPAETAARFTLPRHELSDNPVLFRRSSTFGESPAPAGDASAKLHRSETVPAGGVAASLANIGSSIKSGFGRYSPARMSLRAADVKLPRRMLENAIGNISSGGIAVKRSNEIIQGGISTLRSAATSVVRRFDEMLSAGTATDGDRAEDAPPRPDPEDGGGPPEEGYPVGLPDNLYPRDPDRTGDPEPDAVRASLCSCSRCHNCGALLYDDDIMGGWSADDSDLNARCPSCSKSTVPLLSVSVVRSAGAPPERTSVPYLNPLVLRKELESVLAREGDACLAGPGFAEGHPIVYWNLVWALERSDVRAHLAGLLAPGRPVRVRCLWDDPRLHPDAGPPLRSLPRPRRAGTRLADALLTERPAASPPEPVRLTLDGLRDNDLTECLRSLLEWRESSGGEGRSLYREALFLAWEALGEANVDPAAFHREYAAAMGRVGRCRFRPCDRPPSARALCCRHYFAPLSLSPSLPCSNWRSK